MSSRSPDPNRTASTSGIRREPFGTTADGRAVERFTLASASGVTISVLSFGGVIQSILVPDRSGKPVDVTLGYDTLAEYEKDKSYLGALVGRYANRIRAGRFSLDGRDFTLAQNAGGNHLHGGTRGFNKAVWTVEPFEDGDDLGLALQHVSPDGDEGYPGTLRVRVTYRLTTNGELAIDFSATTDAATPVNLTQHAYFNLAGSGSGDILGHVLELNASRFTPVDATLIPTGELRSVRGTPFDFSTPETVGARIGEDDEQLRLAGGYDHTFVLDRSAANELALAARLTDPTSRRGIDIYTTEPGIQFYTGNFLDGTVMGKGGVPHRYRSGLALETQHFPNSPNEPAFPSTILHPGTEHRSRTVYHFVVRD
ncbi:MAG: galactose-1-epimerase [Gemmatimonadetes bacterium]|nr:MAG: galactose-1-epimerase [Gemmatimonadota bacterium]